MANQFSLLFSGILFFQEIGVIESKLIIGLDEQNTILSLLLTKICKKLNVYWLYIYNKL